ncbi:MAG: hypothetical protein U0984_07555 [Prosthecobacter sp.]|nr:hypothetical protein [Prosthecobacter sp.]
MSRIWKARDGYPDATVQPAPDADAAAGAPVSLFPEGMPLTWFHGVNMALFLDAFFGECVISEGLDDRTVVYIGRKGHMMALNRVTAGQLAPILKRFAETGKLPVPTAPNVPCGTNLDATDDSAIQPSSEDWGCPPFS